MDFHNNFTISNSRAMEFSAADGQFEVRCVLTWLLMLVGYGAYMVMTLGNAKTSFGSEAGDADGFETMDANDGATEYSIESEATVVDAQWEPPAFSLEGLLHWLYRRCTGREERAAADRNPIRLERYRQRKLALQEMLTFLHHCTPLEYQRAHEMLHTISDLSEDEMSPTEQETEGIDLGAAAASTVAAGMAMGISGCDGSGEEHGKPIMSFQTTVLMSWTLLCCLYTWWMLRTGSWQPVPVTGTPMPTTMLLPEGPTTEESSNPKAEGWVTFTCLRVLQRLQRAERQNNVGRTLKYQQWRRWLMSFITHLPGSSDERERMVETLRDEHALSTDGDSPLHQIPQDARDHLVETSAQVYGHICGLLENVTLDEAISLLQLFAEANKPVSPPDEDDDDDDSMGVSETDSQKRRRYLRDPMCECSDPEYWMAMHHGGSDEDSDAAEEF
eukprot:s2356_g18.t1